MTDNKDNDTLTLGDNSFGKLPDHLLIEIFIRVPVSEWVQLSCVRKQWANLFRGECLWQAALTRTFPLASQAKRWPGPIPRGHSKRLNTPSINPSSSSSMSFSFAPSPALLIKGIFGDLDSMPSPFPPKHGKVSLVGTFDATNFRRRFTALYVSQRFFELDEEIHEIIGHTFLFLKEQLEHSTMPLSSGVLHGTIIDQFIACGKSRDMAHELASRIWLAVLDNLEENEQTFLLLKRLAFEGDVFLPYPYSRSIKVQWRVFEKLLTDFRDCFNQADYYDVLALAKNKFQPIPSAWLGY